MFGREWRLLVTDEVGNKKKDIFGITLRGRKVHSLLRVDQLE